VPAAVIETARQRAHLTAARDTGTKVR